MKYTVLAYYDQETEHFNPPMLVPFQLQDAIDSVIDGVKKGKVEDAKVFELYHLGFYDTDDAKFDLIEKKKVLVLSDYVRD